MLSFRVFLARLRALFASNKREQELDAEVRAHLDLLVEENIRRGMNIQDARLTARREFGGVEQTKEIYRRQRGLPILETLLQDVRFGMRTLRKNPGFTAITVLTLALGIGAHTAIFSFAYSLFYQSLPVRDPGRLVNLYFTEHASGYHGFSYPGYFWLRDHTKSFESIAAHYSTAPLHVISQGASEEVNSAVVSANYFSMLGLQPLLGRFFLPEEDAVPDRNPVAVISYDYWQTRFAGGADILGKKLRINGTLFEIIGVAPQGFHGALMPFANQIWIPTSMLRVGYRWCDTFTNGCTPLDILGRPHPGVAIERAQAELSTLAGHLAAEYEIPEKDAGILVWPARGVRPFERTSLGPSVQLLLAASGLLLLIVGANIAGLLVSRAEARRREFAIRVAIGAGRSRLVRQWLTESTLLALLGGAGGLVIWTWARRFLLGVFAPGATDSARYYDLHFSPWLVVYSLSLSLLLGFLLGIFPALQAARRDPLGGLKNAADSAGSGRIRLRSALVAAQVALSLPLVISAALIARSASNIHSGATFDAAHVVVLRTRPKLLGYTPAQGQAFQREVNRRIAALPGVQSFSFAEDRGLVWGTGAALRVHLPGQAFIRPEDERSIPHHEVGPNYFHTLGISLIAGREFDDRDGPASQRVVIVNETLSKIFWNAVSPVGQSLVIEGRDFQVIGLAKDAHLRSALDAPQAALFVPYWQNNFEPPVDSRMCIRVAGNPRDLLPTIRQAITAADPEVPLSEDVPMTEQVDDAFQPVLLAMTVLKFAGAMALFLSAIGLYGVLAYVVARRTREIGIRVALGAQRGDILRIVFRQGTSLAISGMAIGFVTAAALTGLLASLLYGVPTRDPLIFASSSLVLLGAVLAACYFPARRAMSVDPMVALRHE